MSNTMFKTFTELFKSVKDLNENIIKPTSKVLKPVFRKIGLTLDNPSLIAESRLINSIYFSFVKNVVYYLENFNEKHDVKLKEFIDYRNTLNFHKIHESVMANKDYMGFMTKKEVMDMNDFINLATEKHEKIIELLIEMYKVLDVYQYKLDLYYKDPIILQTAKIISEEIGYKVNSD